MYPDEPGVYAIIDSKMRAYIGATTKSLNDKWKQHQRNLQKRNHHCKFMQNVFYKGYILEFIPLEINDDPWKAEQEWWDRFKEQGYEMMNGRPDGNGGYIFDEETRKK